jgi:hypothetical protein
VFERFNDRARRVLVLAQEEARLLTHSFIGTEHILLGLIQEDYGVAAHALRSAGVSLEAARAMVDETVGPMGAAPSGSPPFTPRAKKVLELSLREAMQLGHSYIGTEHLLLGLIREGEGVAIAVLVSLGTDLGALRQRTLQLMKEGHGGVVGVVGSPASASEWGPPAWDRPSEGTLPSIVAVGKLVLRNDLVTVSIDHLEVYPNGFTISLMMRVDPRRMPDAFALLRTLGPARWPNVGVRFADGRTARQVSALRPATDLSKDEEGIPTEPIITMGGGGGPRGWRASAWVFPLPPEGPVEIATAMEEAGLEESSISLEGAAIRAAAERAMVVWT